LGEGTQRLPTVASRVVLHGGGGGVVVVIVAVRIDSQGGRATLMVRLMVLKGRRTRAGVVPLGDFPAVPTTWSRQCCEAWRVNERVIVGKRWGSGEDITTKEPGKVEQGVWCFG
jgi:hypothetical protein